MFLAFLLDHIGSNANAADPATRLFEVLLESFKLVLGATIGALSMSVSGRSGRPQADSGQDNKPKSSSNEE